eukprot:CAMPEP_0184690728 /NCGR_PEP_ID=MMETSP0312-20130426/31398_1 /TAXON_ID=31354 /ORGANISM="Compsopogon coeruleus, Strain SAG 36.94" /LENGTH=735 /DNA_ID=CAMNT_0027148277 /DNA_START=108 /DNA_END=2315 /DNA_ORIENTATION=-
MGEEESVHHGASGGTTSEGFGWPLDFLTLPPEHPEISAGGWDLPEPQKSHQMNAQDFLSLSGGDAVSNLSPQKFAAGPAEPNLHTSRAQLIHECRSSMLLQESGESRSQTSSPTLAPLFERLSTPETREKSWSPIPLAEVQRHKLREAMNRRRAASPSFSHVLIGGEIPPDVLGPPLTNHVPSFAPVPSTESSSHPAFSSSTAPLPAPSKRTSKRTSSNNNNPWPKTNNLGSMDGITAQIEALWPDSVAFEVLHEMCDGKGPTSPSVMKKTILSFVPNVSFKKETWTRKLGSLQKLQLELLCGTLQLKKTGKKAELIARIIAFMSATHNVINQTPKPTGTQVKQRSGTAQEGEIAQCNFLSGESPYHVPLSPPLRVTNPYSQERLRIVSGLQLDARDATFSFQLSSDFKTRTYPGAEIQIHLRCLRLDSKTNPEQWKQSWPFPAFAKVNGHAVQLNQAQRFTNGKLAGFDMANDITQFLHPSGNSANVVSVRRNRSGGSVANGFFVLFAQEVAVLSTEQVIEDVKARSLVYWSSVTSMDLSIGLPESASPFECDLAGVQNFMKQDGVAVERVKVSLRCPLALIRMEIPVRSKHCKHIQCFDLRAYVDYSRKSLKFNCPFCNKPNALPENLVISPFIEQAIHTCTNADEIEIKEDGSYSGVPEPERSGDTSSTEFNPFQIRRSSAEKDSTIVDLTMESDDETDVLSTIGKLSGNGAGTRPFQVDSAIGEIIQLDSD